MISEEESLRIAQKIMDNCLKKYQRENPCPKCGSHNVDIDIDTINGVSMSGSEWCNDCGWRKVTKV
jgi:transcription elongation factor Elf1